jgi:hypothetical protein
MLKIPLATGLAMILAGAALTLTPNLIPRPFK